MSACGINEGMLICFPCPPLNCGDRSDTICTIECTPNKKCHWKSGYLRNKEGICVKEAECDEI